MTNFLPKFGKIDKICPENPGYAPDELCVTPGPGCPFIRESPKMTPFSYKVVLKKLSVYKVRKNTKIITYTRPYKGPYKRTTFFLL